MNYCPPALRRRALPSFVPNARNVRPPAMNPGGAYSYGSAPIIGAPPPSGLLVPAATSRMPHDSIPRREDQSSAVVEQRAGVAAVGVSVKAIVTVPSARLRVKLGLVFVPDNPSAVFTFDPTDVWQVTPLYFVEAVGDYFPGQNVFSSTQPLPSAYETDTAAERFLITATIGGAADANHPLGIWYVTASWEPGSGVDMSDAERADLFTKCQILPSSLQKVLGQ